MDDAAGVEAALRVIGRQEGGEGSDGAGDETEFPSQVTSVHDAGIKTEGAHHTVDMGSVAAQVDTKIRGGERSSDPFADSPYGKPA